MGKVSLCLGKKSLNIFDTALRQRGVDRCQDDCRPTRVRWIGGMFRVIDRIVFAFSVEKDKRIAESMQTFTIFSLMSGNEKHKLKIASSTREEKKIKSSTIGKTHGDKPKSLIEKHKKQEY